MSQIPLLVAEAASLPELRSQVAQAAGACSRLRFHEGLRRHLPEIMFESRVRGAHGSAALSEGRASVDRVRQLSVPGALWPPTTDPSNRVTRAAIALTAEVDRLDSKFEDAPRQAVARLHAVAGNALAVGQVGRTRVAGEGCSELLSALGREPEADDARASLFALLNEFRQGVTSPVLLAALVHGEVLRSRPFPCANGLLGRALERLLLRSRHVDSTRAVVPEAGHFAMGVDDYFTAAAAYARSRDRGDMDGVVVWVQHCCHAIAHGAAEGGRVADAARAAAVTRPGRR
ncbi:Uncharacterised protein [Dermatophilus congolensis]|uniref:Fido domain-containing protein n=1 Tax=Dermatophilus congolensis TaxID=1863 RepID=A0AA46BQG1_9MICO|nr:hypothetical protein [Dermatophilus congolensis]STD15772.1 Uncharacterised protein [Dermatophilus congolensis]